MRYFDFGTTAFIQHPKQWESRSGITVVYRTDQLSKATVIASVRRLDRSALSSPWISQKKEATFVCSNLLSLHDDDMPVVHRFHLKMLIQQSFLSRKYFFLFMFRLHVHVFDIPFFLIYFLNILLLLFSSSPFFWIINCNFTHVLVFQYLPSRML